MPSCGARPLLSDSRSMLSIISIHAPREGRDEIAHAALGGPQLISIHAPREGRDLCLWRWTTGKNISIHAPREGRDLDIDFLFLKPYISIHAPREGRDFTGHTPRFVTIYFNPRAPRGARLKF